jgi:hypothetical protein
MLSLFEDFLWLVFLIGAALGFFLCHEAHAAPRKTIIGTFEGTCTAKLFSGWFPCSTKVAYMVLPNGRSVVSFEKDGRMFSFSGGRDRQPDMNDLFLALDTVRIFKGAKQQAVDPHMEGECHLSFNDDASMFREIHCDAWDRQKGLTFFFHLDNINKTNHTSF